MMCSHEGCLRPTWARGLCGTHYRQWSRAAHPERLPAERAAARQWYWANRQRASDKARAYRERNADRVRERNRQRRALRLEKDRLTHLAYVKSHPELVRSMLARRYALRRGARGSHTPEQWRQKCALLGHVCIYCGESKPLTRDHKIPLTRGGSNDIANVVPACGSCNSRKRALTAQEFLAVRRAS